MIADVNIVGLGMRLPDHATSETERVIAACNEVLFVDTGIATAAWLRGLCPRVTDLYAASYHERGERLDAYHAMVARTLDAALDHAPIAFAMQGHPLVYAYAPALLRDLAPLLGLSVSTLPGISSMDCLFADLGLDPCTEGLQLYEATDVLLRARPLQPDVPLLLWQVGTVESRLHTAHTSRPERFFRLRDHLLRYYPAHHEVLAYFAAPFPLFPPRIDRFPLGSLAEQAPTLHPGVTLLVPAIGQRPVSDLDLLAQVDDPAHLARLTNG